MVDVTFKKDNSEKKLGSFKIPAIDMKTIFFVGSFVFTIQAFCSIALFFINIKTQNFFTISAIWSMIFFNLLLGYFFFYSYKSLIVPVTRTVVASDEDFIKEFFKKDNVK